MTDLPDILYIEDEEDYQLLVKNILGRAGMNVRVAGTGAEGLAALRQKRPDVLILDINLPDTQGNIICRQLREDTAFAHLPILMLTVRRRPEEWLRGFSDGANDYLAKPINPPELIERVTNCLSASPVAVKEGSAEFQLIQAAVAGNRSAFQVLIEQFRQRLTQNVRTCTRSDEEAEEVVAKSFATAYAKMNQFRGESTFYTWIYRIAMFEISHMRRRDHTVSLDAIMESSDAAPTWASSEDTTLEEWADRELAAKTHEALAEVPEAYRTILDLYFLKELSYEEIANRLKMPIGTVMSRLFKARQLLREAWDRMHALS